MHRIPLWLIGPIGLAYVAFGNNPEPESPQVVAAMVVATLLFTVPFLRSEWLVWTGRSCGACRVRFVDGDDVYVDAVTGRSQMCVDCGLYLRPDQLPRGWQPGTHQDRSRQPR